jgi:hypothetical protein
MPEFFDRVSSFTFGQIHGDAGGRRFNLLKKAVMVPAGIDGFGRIYNLNGKTNRTIPHF